MRNSIIRTALMEKVRLELDYREPSKVHDSPTDFNQPRQTEAGSKHDEQPLTDEMVCLLNLI
jgi:hypothetical protein